MLWTSQSESFLACGRSNSPGSLKRSHLTHAARSASPVAPFSGWAGVSFTRGFSVQRLKENHEGFTLVELLVVMLLVGLLTALAFPSLTRGISTLKLRTSSREIAATLRLARSKAIAEQQIYWVSFDMEKNQIELSSNDHQFRKSFELPQDIGIAKVSTSGIDEPGSRRKVSHSFAPNGMAESFEVLIQNRRGRGIRVFQNSLMRSPRLEEVASEGSGMVVVR
jgi:type II secretion system protein H